MSTASLFRLLVLKVKFKFPYSCSLFVKAIAFILLRFNSNPHSLLYCSYIDILFCKSSIDSKKVAKSSPKNKLFILLSYRYGNSFRVSEDLRSSSNRPGK